MHRARTLLDGQARHIISRRRELPSAGAQGAFTDEQNSLARTASTKNSEQGIERVEWSSVETAAWGACMSTDYLLKTEPSEYSFADLQKDGVTVWEGVTSPAGVMHLREIEPGARLVIYETANRKSAVGTATAISVDASNPKVPIVKIKAGKPIEKPWTLAQVKADKRFAGSPLVREGRLSVVPLTKAQYAALTGA